MFIRRYKKLVAGISIVAVLVTFFSTTAAYALSEHSDTGLIHQQVCTQTGTKMVDIVVPSKPASTPHHNQLGDHHSQCLLCCASAHAQLLLNTQHDLLPSLWHPTLVLVPRYLSPIRQLSQYTFPPQQAPPILD